MQADLVLSCSRKKVPKESRPKLRRWLYHCFLLREARLPAGMPSEIPTARFAKHNLASLPGQFRLSSRKKQVQLQRLR